jgi:hypothetical protein
MMYIESEFALLEANNERLERENKKLVAALESTQKLLDDIYAEDSIISSGDLGTVYEKNLQALAPYQEECTCLPDLPDGRVNGGRGGCCPVCEADSKEIYIGGE